MDRLLEPKLSRSEEQYDVSLRPLSLNEYVGQENFKENLFREIFRNHKLNEYIEEFKKDEELIRIKEIISVLKSDVKTLNISYSKDGKEMNFKIEANPSISKYKYGYEISNWNICDGKVKHLFEETYRTEDDYSPDIYLNNIESITYARKTLYKK